MRRLYLLLAVGGWLSAASADPLWVGTYNGPGNSYDEVRAIGADDSGNVIVSGFSSLGDNDEEFVTIKPPARRRYRLDPALPILAPGGMAPLRLPLTD